MTKEVERQIGFTLIELLVVITPHITRRGVGQNTEVYVAK